MSWFHFPSYGIGEVVQSEFYNQVEVEEDYPDMLDYLKRVVARPIPKGKKGGGVQLLPFSLEGNPGMGKSTIMKEIVHFVRHGGKWVDPVDKVLRGYDDSEIQAIYLQCDETVSTEFHIESMMKHMENKPVTWMVFDDVLNLPTDDLKQFLAKVRHKWATRLCELRDIVIEEDAQPIEYIDEGLPVVVLIYQQRYQMDSKARDYLRFQLKVEHSIEHYYKETDKQIYGEEAVKKGHNRSAGVLLGYYNEIGAATLLIPVWQRGLVAGKIRFPFEKFRKLNEVFDKVINIVKEHRGEGYSVRQNIHEDRIRRVDPSVLNGLEDMLGDQMYQDEDLTRMFCQGKVEMNGEQVWDTNYPISSSNMELKEFYLKERMRIFVNKLYSGKSFVTISEECEVRRQLFYTDNEQRLKLNVTFKTITDRSVGAYYGKIPKFFKHIVKARTQLGLWMEKFLRDKLIANVVYFSRINDEKYKEILSKVEVVQGYKMGDRSVDVALLYNGKPFFLLNVKNLLSDTSKLILSPEKELALEAGIRYGVVIYRNYYSKKLKDYIFELRYNSWDAETTEDQLSVGRIPKINTYTSIIKTIINELVIIYNSSISQ